MASRTKPLTESQCGSEKNSSSHRSTSTKKDHSPSPKKTTRTSVGAEASLCTRPSSNISTHPTKNTPEALQASPAHIPKNFTNVSTDILEMAAWIPENLVPYHSQPSSVNMQDSTCQPHTLKLATDSCVHTAGYGMAPVARWLKEDVVDDSVLGLQVGVQLYGSCIKLDKREEANVGNLLLSVFFFLFFNSQSISCGGWKVQDPFAF
ncbi:hypothetical protein BGZ60DRAFT_435120 [Tricladium varicosporioides]|nr:hypothetical protein BGZ60DRAFT_435120 [Hymenoscyphus varicosporioides]